MDFFSQNIIPGEVLVQLVAFLTVFFTLKKLAWKPVQAALETRRKKIQDELSHIDHAKLEIEKLKAEYNAHLQKIEDEARAKIQQGVDEGRRVAREIQEKARTDAQAVFDKSKENLLIEIEKARITLRQEIAGLAVQVAEKIVQEKMTDDKQQEKAVRIIEELEKSL